METPNETEIIVDQPAVITEELRQMGITMACSRAVGKVVGELNLRDPDSRPHIMVQYAVTLALNGIEFYTGPYSMGSGLVKTPPQKDLIRGSMLWPRQQVWALQVYLKPGFTRFVHQEDYTEAAYALAFFANHPKSRSVPRLLDVLYCMLMDGSAHFDHLTHEDWCAELGYDVDSIKAREIYRTCDDIGRKLIRAFGEQGVAKLRKLFADY